MDEGQASSRSADRARRWYREYGYVLRQRCLALLGDPAAADDALQEVFVRVLRYGHRPPDKPLAWLKRIADRCCFDLIKKNRRQSDMQRSLSTEREIVETWPAHDPDNVRVVLHLLAKAKPKLQQVAVLFYYDEMTRDEIARELGCSTMTVKRRLAEFRRYAVRARAAHEERESR